LVGMSTRYCGHHITVAEMQRLSRLALLITSGLGSACIVTPTQWQQIATSDAVVKFQAFVQGDPWPVVIECGHPAWPEQLFEITRVTPSATGNTDKLGRSVYSINAEFVVPLKCMDIGTEGHNVYRYAPIVVSQLVSRGTTLYKTQENIYTFDANGVACATGAWAKTSTFAAIFERSCYAKNGDDSPRRELWVMTRPEFSA
jgi:hypothetical protein